MCSKCLRSPAQHPSLRQGASGSAAGLSLELDSVRKKPAGTGRPHAAARPARPRASPPQVFAADFETEDIAGFDVGLDLGEDEDSRAPVVVKAAPRAQRSIGGPQAELRPPEVAAEEVRQLAGYGPEPSSLLAAPLYSWRVFKRRRELLAQLAQRRRAHQQLDRSHKQQLSGLAAEIRRSVRDPGSPVLAILERLQAESSTVAQRAAQLAATQEQFAAEIGRIDAEIASAECERDQCEKQCKLARIRLEDSLQQQHQNETRLKHAGQRVQTLHDAARAAAGDAAKLAPPEHAPRIRAAEEQVAKLTSEASRLRDMVSTARDKVREQERALAAAEHRLSSIFQRKQAMHRQAEEALGLRVAGLRQAEDEQLTKAEHAVRSILIEHPDSVPKALHRQVRELDQQLSASALDLRKCELAPAAFNPELYRRGITVAAAATVLLLLLIGLLLWLA